MNATQDQNTFAAILNTALTQPGVINDAYRAFHNYSFGNQLLAACQLIERGLSISPIASFNTWKEKGRFVKKGEKAIKLSMPITQKGEKEGDNGEKQEYGFTRFILRPNWFSYDQTEGAEFAPELKTPAWDGTKALAALGIEEVPFAKINGNSQGYAVGDQIAINPLAKFKHKTRFHELAHVVLGHTKEMLMTDSEMTPKDIKEVEAESVAYLLTTLLDMPGQAESRDYVQGWANGQPITERSAQKIFATAQKIMAAGQ